MVTVTADRHTAFFHVAQVAEVGISDRSSFVAFDLYFSLGTLRQRVLFCARKHCEAPGASPAPRGFRGVVMVFITVLVGLVPVG